MRKPKWYYLKSRYAKRVGKEDSPIKNQAKTIFWTRVMAIGAIAAAIFTCWNTSITRAILLQARDDSKLEYRPYVILDLGSFSGDKIRNENEYEVFLVKFNAFYRNFGKTPAINFNCGFGISNCKFDSNAKIIKFDKGPRETSTVLMGDIVRSVERTFEIQLPNNIKAGDIAMINIRNQNLPFEIQDVSSFPIYYYFDYSYADLNGAKYHETCGICILFNIQSKKFDLVWDSFFMENKRLMNKTNSL
jgi:hypothetical protein